MLLSSFTHRRQRRESDCLVACVEMVFEYLHIPATYDQLAKRLDTQWFGTPFGNIAALKSLGVSVTLEYSGTLEVFEFNIDLGLPVIVNVKTIDWDHWDGEETYHAVVVVGLDREQDVIYIQDPYFDQAPIELKLTTFMIGWEEQMRQYAVISLTPTD